MALRLVQAKADPACCASAVPLNGLGDEGDTEAASDVVQVAFYGKGGIGKSTTVANVSAALAMAGRKVLQVGCDPKHDSSRPFWNGRRPATIMDMLKLGQSGIDGAEYVYESEVGVSYMEVGGPDPGVGCAGRGILKMFEVLDETNILESGYDSVIYDVLGDVVCGGFAAPLRAGRASDVYIVTSGEFMAMFAANNICRSIATHSERKHVRLGGIILNCRDVPRERQVVEAFAERVGTKIVACIPRSKLIADAERERRTLVEIFPDSEEAKSYRALASQIRDTPDCQIPKVMDDDELEEMYFRERDSS